MTRRQEIIQMLEMGEWSLERLANYFRTTLKDLLLDFEHIPKSIRPRKLKITPACCNKCGYLFRDRTRINRPSKCPMCKSEWIEPAKYRIA